MALAISLGCNTAWVCKGGVVCGSCPETTTPLAIGNITGAFQTQRGCSSKKVCTRMEYHLHDEDDTKESNTNNDSEGLLFTSNHFVSNCPLIGEDVLFIYALNIDHNCLDINYNCIAAYCEAMALVLQPTYCNTMSHKHEAATTLSTITSGIITSRPITPSNNRVCKYCQVVMNTTYVKLTGQVLLVLSH